MKHVLRSTIEGSHRVWPRTVPLVAVLGLGLLLRVIFLDSDPVYYLWSGYIADEGRWTELAREWALFGRPDMDSQFSRIHFVLAPIYQALTAISFASFGVGFTSARLVSALSGVGLLVGAVILLRRSLSNASLLFLALALAIQPDLLFLSRMAIPETAALLFEFLAFSLILSQPRSAKRAFGAGLLTAIALGMKATVAPVVPLLAITVVVVHGAKDLTSRLRRSAAYGAGVVAPAVVILGASTLFVGAGALEQLGPILTTVRDFIRLDSTYSALSSLFYDGFAPAVNVLLVPAWCAAGVLLAVGKRLSGPAWEVYVGSAIWVSGWILVSSALAYFPERYVFHVLVPLSVNVGAGFTLLQGYGGEEILDSVRNTKGVRGVIVRAWWSLPAAILAAPIFLSVVGSPFGLSVDKFSVQVPAILLSSLAMVAVRPRREQVGRFFWFTLLVAPLIFAPLFLLAFQAQLGFMRFWTFGTSDMLAKVALLMLAVATVAVVYSAPNWRATVRRCAYAYVIPLALLWSAQIGPRFLAPTYTISEISSQIDYLGERRLPVATIAGASLFLGNRIRYHERLYDGDPGGSGAELVVAAFSPLRPLFAGDYEILAVRELPVGLAHIRFAEDVRQYEPRVWIYRRRKGVESTIRP